MKLKTLTLVAFSSLFLFNACKKEDLAKPCPPPPAARAEIYHISGKFGNKEFDIKTGVDNYTIVKDVNSVSVQFKSNCFISRGTRFYKPHSTRNFPSIVIAMKRVFASQTREDCQLSFEEFKAIVKKGEHKISSGNFMANIPSTYEGAYLLYIDESGKVWDSGPGYVQNNRFVIEEVKVGSIEKQELIITFKIKCELFNGTDTKVIELNGKCPLYNTTI